MTPTKEEMRARLAQEVEGWRPEPGDEVFGTIVTVDEREGKFGPYPYLEIDDEDTGKVVGVHCFHTVLKKEVVNKAPKVGGVGGVHYFGIKTPKNGGDDYEHYKFDYYPPDGNSAPAPNWDAMADDVELGETVADKVTDAFPGTEEEVPF